MLVILLLVSKKQNVQESEFYISLLICRGVVTYKGKLVENLHVVMAQKIVQQNELIEKMKQLCVCSVIIDYQDFLFSILFQ